MILIPPKKKHRKVYKYTSDSNQIEVQRENIIDNNHIIIIVEVMFNLSRSKSLSEYKMYYKVLANIFTEINNRGNKRKRIRQNNKTCQ